MSSVAPNGTRPQDPYYSTEPADLARAVQAALAGQKPHWTEAPASVNTYLHLDGHQVQLTLRDSDETRLLSRLHAILAQFPVNPPPPVELPPAPAPVPQPPLEERPDWCSIHGTAMGKQSNAKGSWYSHKTMDGWCNGKRRKASA
jgi:hypothetical protein